MKTLATVESENIKYRANKAYDSLGEMINRKHVLETELKCLKKELENIMDESDDILPDGSLTPSTPYEMWLMLSVVINM